MPIYLPEATSSLIQSMTPRQIVAELDKYVVGQHQAKRAVAIALRNRMRRQKLSREMAEEVIPKNILMIGPTGVGKTEIARRLAKLANAPFVKIEATKFTEVGYVGRDVDSMVRDLAQISHQLVEAEHVAGVQESAREQAMERIVDLLQPPHRTEENDFSANPAGLLSSWVMMGGRSGSSAEQSPEENEERHERDRKRSETVERIRTRLREQVRMGVIDDRPVELEVEEGPTVSFMPAFSDAGMEEIGVN